MKYILIVLAIVVGVGGLVMYLINTSTQNNEQTVHQDKEVEAFEIYPGDVAKKIASEENFVLLDVRTPEEYAEVHLKGALLLPVQELSQKTLTAIGLGEDAKDKEIILYCRSGARSKTAYNIMEQLGYTNIKSVAGGMIHWEEDEYPFTESGEYDGTQTSIDSPISQVSDPNISFDRAFHDFGRISQFGGVVETIFTVRNTGMETLEIGDIATSCSCTSASISSTAIPAGKEAELTVRFDPDFHEEPLGVFKRTVFIQTNDPDMREAEITIQVDIIEGE